MFSNVSLQENSFSRSQIRTCDQKGTQDLAKVPDVFYNFCGKSTKN